MLLMRKGGGGRGVIVFSDEGKEGVGPRMRGVGL